MVAGGSLLLTIGCGLGLGGTVALAADRTGRDAAGFLSSPSRTFTTTAYALTSDAVDLREPDFAGDVLGDVRVRAESRDGRGVFVGIARTADVARYLGGVGHTVVRDWGDRDRNVRVGGGAPAVPPGDAGIWVASASGTGRQSVVWEAAAARGPWS